ncbi:hypothetical protein ISS07_01400 [Candidatus Woesearchaeota archaeon]|nr:hypothetical protein [Candidatus Woesearchaeota archaeon]
MEKKRLGKKSEQGASSYKMLIKILLVMVIAGILYFMIRRIGNAFVPQ